MKHYFKLRYDIGRPDSNLSLIVVDDRSPFVRTFYYSSSVGHRDGIAIYSNLLDQNWIDKALDFLNDPFRTYLYEDYIRTSRMDFLQILSYFMNKCDAHNILYYI